MGTERCIRDSLEGGEGGGRALARGGGDGPAPAEGHHPHGDDGGGAEDDAAHDEASGSVHGSATMLGHAVDAGSYTTLTLPPSGLV